MKRYLFGLIASVALLAALPAASVAKSHHHARDHRRHDRIEHFRRGHDAPSQPGTQDAGTVQSFQDGTLTIKLTDGSTVSGAVTPGTEVECQSMDRGDFSRADGTDRSSGRDGSDDNGGNDGGRDDGGRDDNDGGSPSCMTALQTAGTQVRDATLQLTSAGAAWNRVDLDA